MKSKNTMFLVQAAAIGAIYVVLTLLFAPLGCILSTLLGGAIPVDIIFGSIATLIGAVFTYKLRGSSKWLAPLPPIVANTVIVPFVLYYGYGVNLPIPLMMLTVGAGEVISCGIFGMIVLTALSKVKGSVFGKASYSK